MASFRPFIVDGKNKNLTYSVYMSEMKFLRRKEA